MCTQLAKLLLFKILCSVEINCGFTCLLWLTMFGLLSGCSDYADALGCRMVGRKSLRSLLSWQRVSLQCIETPSTATHKRSAYYTHCLLRLIPRGSGDSNYILVVCEECADGLSLAARVQAACVWSDSRASCCSRHWRRNTGWWTWASRPENGRSDGRHQWRRK